ncbi:MAG TPA: TetR/AcrR family transcriptional regulator [Rectinemataceae bacterium]|nr:TetR/AcrR family transcriptional regulator [Rectinemataceae bacterium]
MSPRSQEANEGLREDRRKTILDTALQVFVENGFNGTRMQEIAGRCSLSYGLVYHYFPTKEAIFATLVDMALDAAELLVRSLPQGAEPQVFGSLAGFAVSDPSPLYFAIIMEALTKKSVAPGLKARAQGTILALKKALASSGGGEDPKDKGMRAEGILAILLGASIMKICCLSDGTFASRSATMLAASGLE